MVGKRVAHFTIESRLGRGGMASVWKARDDVQGRTVALKLMDEALANLPGARSRFRREAKTVSALDHPAIAPVYESGEADGEMYMSMKFIDGETMSELVQHRLLPLPEAIRVATDVARALAYAHSQGVVHRDVTGRNVMVARDGRVFVLDFGLALVKGASRISSTGTLLGTAAYMAPEVLLGRTASPASDLYSLGVVLYEALTGSLPFEGNRMEIVTFQVTNRPVRPPSALRPEIGPDLDRLVLRLMARDPVERYEQVDRLVAELAALRFQTPAESPPAAAPVRDGDALPIAARVAAGRGPIYLAVLPFEWWDPVSEAAGAPTRLLDALAEAAAAAIASADRVHVVPLPAGARDQAGQDLRGFARGAGCNLVLRANAQLSGTAIRVSYGLIDPEGGERVGGGIVDGSTVLPFELQDRLATSLRAALGIHIDIVPTDQPRRPPDPAADTKLVQALGYMQRFDNEASLDGAIGLLEGLVRSEGESAPLLAALGRAYNYRYQLTRQQRWEGQATAACARARELAPDAPDVLLALGELHVVAGRWAEALNRFDAALAARADLYEALLGRAQALDGLKRRHEAEAACLRAIELRPEDWRGYHVRGLMLFRGGRYDEAEAPWRKVAELTPDNASANRNLCAVYFNLDRFQEAETAIRRSLSVRPSAMGYYNLGTLLFFLERYEESVVVFEKAVALNPADPVAWGNLGNACRLIPGREARAAEALDSGIGLMRERLERAPARGDSWARLAGYLVGRGRPAEAEDAVRRALELSPEDPFCMVMAGHTHFLLGRRDEALRCLAAAVHGGYGVHALRHDPDLKPLWNDPDFLRILEEGAEHHSAERSERTA